MFRSVLRKPLSSTFITCALRNSIIMKRHINSEVILNDTEKKIRSLLVDFCDTYNQSKTEDLLELRITGGWVRDKLLGNHSNDLDIAINHLLGEEFAAHLFEFAESKYPQLTLNSIHTIKKNPEKSKHLETCTTKLYGLDIDFVNLRSEEYTSDSRVPVIECGTAEEDALRRDATLNALFYNLNKDIIEDFTGRGLQDLQDGILRTPLQPLQTFLDDPLRVLRLIRFASRFDFIVENETLQAMTNSDIKSTLVHKISRERVGIEVEKILMSNNPQYGLKLINYVGLTDSIFNAGVLSSTITEVNENALINELNTKTQEIPAVLDIATEFLKSFKNEIQHFPKLSTIFNEIMINNKQTQKLFWLTVILQPYGDLRVRINAKKPNLNRLTEVILKEGLRLGKHEFEAVSNAVSRTVLEHTTLDNYFDDPTSISRSTLGLYLKGCGPYANLNILLNCFIDLLPHIELVDCPKVPQPILDSGITESSIGALKSCLNNYEQLCLDIEKMGLEDIYSTFKPVVDGKTLLAALQRKPGPWLGRVNEQVLIWQLDHPNGTPEECIEHVKSILHQYV